MKLLEQAILLFQEGKSDKVYEVDLLEVAPGQYVVNFRYGRRGTALKDGSKTPAARAPGRGPARLRQARRSPSWTSGYVRGGRATEPRVPPPPPRASAPRRAPARDAPPLRACRARERILSSSSSRSPAPASGSAAPTCAPSPAPSSASSGAWASCACAPPSPCCCPCWRAPRPLRAYCLAAALGRLGSEASPCPRSGGSTRRPVNAGHGAPHGHRGPDAVVRRGHPRGLPPGLDGASCPRPCARPSRRGPGGLRPGARGVHRPRTPERQVWVLESIYLRGLGGRRGPRCSRRCARSIPRARPCTCCATSSRWPSTAATARCSASSPGGTRSSASYPERPISFRVHRRHAPVPAAPGVAHAAPAGRAIESPDFVKMAVGVLLAFSDADAGEPRHHGVGQLACGSWDAWAPYWAFNQLLYRATARASRPWTASSSSSSRARWRPGNAGARGARGGLPRSCGSARPRA